MKPVFPPLRGALVGLLAVVLVGCASTGGLQPRTRALAPTDLHATATLAGVARADTAWPTTAWWKAAGDPQLDRLVDAALAGNPDLELADARVRAALAAAGLADAERKPTLGGSAGLAGARVPPILPPLANGHFGATRLAYLSFKWNLDLWGGKRAAWQAAVGQARATAVDAQAARLRLSASVVQAYFDLAGDYAQQRYARAELKRAEDFLELTRKRVARGIDSRFTLARIAGETATARAHLEAADNAVRTGGTVLAALLGEGPDRALALTPPRLPATPALVLPEDLPANLLGRRPDVVAARWRVEAARQDIRSARAKFLPNLGISSLAGLIAPTTLNFMALGNRFYTVQPALALPIFEGGALRANLAGKDAARDIAVAQYNQTLVHVISQVATQADAVRSLAAQVTDADHARASAAEAYDLAMQRYRAGVGSFLEALSVRQELIAAEQQQALLETRRSVAWAMLNEALGGGFQAAADTPTVATSPAPPSAAKVRQ